MVCVARPKGRGVRSSSWWAAQSAPIAGPVPRAAARRARHRGPNAMGAVRQGGRPHPQSHHGPAPRRGGRPRRVGWHQLRHRVHARPWPRARPHRALHPALAQHARSIASSAGTESALLAISRQRGTEGGRGRPPLRVRWRVVGVHGFPSRDGGEAKERFRGMAKEVGAAETLESSRGGKVRLE
jgi:hypothetical protein